MSAAMMMAAAMTVATSLGTAIAGAIAVANTVIIGICEVFPAVNRITVNCGADAASGIIADPVAVRVNKLAAVCRKRGHSANR